MNADEPNPDEQFTETVPESWQRGPTQGPARPFNPPEPQPARSVSAFACRGFAGLLIFIGIVQLFNPLSESPYPAPGCIALGLYLFHMAELKDIRSEVRRLRRD
jgi:hypothetical protein